MTDEPQPGGMRPRAWREPKGERSGWVEADRPGAGRARIDADLRKIAAEIEALCELASDPAKAEDR